MAERFHQVPPCVLTSEPTFGSETFAGSVGAPIRAIHCIWIKISLDTCARCRNIQSQLPTGNQGKTCVLSQLKLSKLSSSPFPNLFHMLFFQAHFFPQVWLVSIKCPYISNNAGVVSSVSPALVFVPYQGFCMSSLFFKLPKALFFVFNTTYFQDWRELLWKWLWSVSLCVFIVPAIAQGLTEITSALYWRMHTCVACVASQWGPAHMQRGGGHGLIKPAHEKNSVAFVLEKQKTVMNTLFHGCLSRSELRSVCEKAGSGA